MERKRRMEVAIIFGDLTPARTKLLGTLAHRKNDNWHASVSYESHHTVFDLFGLGIGALEDIAI